MSNILNNAKKTFEIEANTILNLKNSLDFNFERAVEEILCCNGKVVITAVGKSSHIGRKIAATLSSTGTSSLFIHSTEALHGDLGMLAESDIVIAISFSGETDELLRTVSAIKSNNGNKIIAITGNKKSTLAMNSEYVLWVNVEKEACPFNLVPTTSTTATLAMGDALAVALMEEKQFELEDFAKLHPGGNLGRRLLTRVEDTMIKENFPIASTTTTMREIIPIMNIQRLGMAVIVENGKVKGVITDGDVRRGIEKEKNFLEMTANEVMTREPKVVSRDAMIVEAEEIMKKNNINSLLVVDNSELVGIIRVFHR